MSRALHARLACCLRMLIIQCREAEYCFLVPARKLRTVTHDEAFEPSQEL